MMRDLTFRRHRLTNARQQPTSFRLPSRLACLIRDLSNGETMIHKRKGPGQSPMPLKKTCPGGVQAQGPTGAYLFNVAQNPQGVQ